ncbi:Protein ltv1 [Rhizina undulata]
MAPSTKKWIDKKNATTFQVRYRSQQDPLIHDETASDFVFTQVDAPNTGKVKTTHQLEEELGLNASKIRSNEGEAAMYGIYFDDTEYDYMQHMRDMGTTTEAVFIEAPQAQSKQNKGKGKQKLEDAIREQFEPEPLIPKELLPSETQLNRTYQDQQDVPDALKGFQPDMDPRLREVLEALEDEEYVDDDEDLFGELTKGGETSERDFEAGLDDFLEEGDDDGWESDVTEKPAHSSRSKKNAGGEAEEWMKEFSKFKKAEKSEKKVDDGASSIADTMSFGGTSSIGGTMSISGRRRRRKCTKTASTGYSMSSSALFRTEGLSLLDDRFDRIEEEYNEDDAEDDGPHETVPETRQDFNSIMDEFLGNYSMVGKGRVRRGKYQTGLDQLDEIRRELGSARIR